MTTAAAASSTANPRELVSLVILTPSTLIILYP